MEGLLALLGLYLVAVLVVLPIVAVVKMVDHEKKLEGLRMRIRSLEEEAKRLSASLRDVSEAMLSKFRAPAPSAVGPEPAAAAEAAPAPWRAPAPEPEPARPEPPPLPAVPDLAAATAGPPEPRAETFSAPPVPPPLAAPEPMAPAVEGPRPGPSFNWEQFMGAKLFAWLGGLALFLCVAFFVKYSFEHDLIPPQVRVALGFLLGAGLIVGGLRISPAKYRVTAQTLVATGVVSLYAVTFACGSVYHFAFFGPVATFLLMALVTAAAFLVAVRLDAQVVAILGILGGFLTPFLINTGHDNPAGLFGYVAVLVVGLLAVALHRGWSYLVPLGAGGTVLMLVGWADKFYAPEKTGIAMAVCLGFSGLFLATAEAARRMGRESIVVGRTAIVLPAVAFCFAAFFLSHPSLYAAGDAAHPGAEARIALLFGFVLLASLCLFAVAWRQGLGELVAGAAGGSALLMALWSAGTLATPQQAPVIVAVCLVFSAVYFAVYLGARRLGNATAPVLWSAVGMPAVSLGFAWFLTEHAVVGARPGLLFGLILAADVLLLALAWLDERLPKLHYVAGLAVFALLARWTAHALTDALLPWAMAASLLFAALHTAFPLVLERRRPASAPGWWNQLFPPLALVLVLIPIFKFEVVSFLVWPVMLLVDVIAIAVAVFSASLVAVAAVLVLTLIGAAATIFRVPAELALEPSLLLVIGGFAVFFFVAGIWVVRRLGERLPEAVPGLEGVFGSPRTQIPALSSLLPFILLIMMCGRLAVANPSPVFGLGLLLVVLTLGLARQLVAEWLPACALAGMAALEYVWHARHVATAAPGLPLAWYAAVYAVFAAYPFVFRRDFARFTGPWAVAALSGPAQFWMVYQTIKWSWPNGVLGLVPAVFAVAPLVSLAAVVRMREADNPEHLNQLAWLGGVALFFITLIVPVQFDRQWITVGWALEGAALLWLFHRIPHPGLRAIGALLLGVVFVRLALNPAVLSYHLRGDAPLLNWYLYAYGVAAGSLFAGGRLLAPPRETILGLNVRPALYAFGVILSFILLNIEIADYFTLPGAPALAFQFSGNFARDMSYTIGWALFALGLLVAGIAWGQKAVRYAAIGLLSVALLKLFFHDLARLEALYRIGALFAVAVVAILASFAYQRFLPSNEKTLPAKP
jgi:uncharacterized membrane protein